jgi:sarcosine oxidase
MNNKNSFDVIVLGVGSMGSSACYYLSKRGYKVLGLEQFDITHELGSHAGQSRIIRKAYFEHPDYVPLLNRSYKNWKELEEETGEQIYFQTGLCYFGSHDHPIIKGVKHSASEFDLEIKVLDALSAAEHFPQFKIPGDFECLHEPNAGFVTPEKAIRVYADLAKKKGASIHVQEKVMEWKKDEDGFVVKTNKDSYRGNKLIITTGAWSGKMIPGFQQKLKVTRQFLAWVKMKNENEFSYGNFPCWLIADEEKHDAYYGFPQLPAEKFGPPGGMKLAHHFAEKETDPDNVNRQITEEDENDLKYLLDKYFPGEFESFLSTKVCLYTNTPDEDFIIDKLPGNEDVVIATGFSGHGFKFVSVVGEILTDLAMDGKTELPIRFLNAKRFE